MAIPVILDTDIGDDIDDALALALALRSPELEVVGITTVYQCAELRTRLAAFLLESHGRSDIPIRAGTDRPLLGVVRPDWSANQATILPDTTQWQPHPEHAVPFLIREAFARDGLVILALGPVTNIALALALEPRLRSRIRIVAMGGAWDRATAEYNVACDPEALACVMAAQPNISFVGLDVTTQMRLPIADLNRILCDPLLPNHTLARFLRAWQGGKDLSPVLHDPLAVAAVFAPDLFTWSPAAVAVELAPPPVRGQTIRTHGSPNANLATAVQTPVFLQLFRQRVCLPT